VERIRVRTIEFTWDPRARLAHISFTEPTRAVGDDARALVAALESWIGAGGAPFALLGDGGRLASLDAEYRAVWSSFFKQHRKTASIAFYNMSAVVRVAAELFRLGTGVNMRAFSTEDEARAWLRAGGFA